MGERSNDPLSPDYVPSMFKHLLSPLKRKRARDVERFERFSLAKKRKNAEVDKQTAAPALLALLEDGNGTLSCEPHTGCYCSTVLSMADIDLLEARCIDLEKQNKHYQKKCHDLEEECQKLVTENATLKKDFGNMVKECTELREVNRKLTETINKQTLTNQSFKNNDSKVKYYTELPSLATLMALFTFVSASTLDSSKTSLSPFQQYIMVLMTLRLNFGAQDIAYRFGVSQSMVSRYFGKWINVMYVRLQPLVKWPEHDELRKTLPMDFRGDFQKCTVIIDCFEIFIERPTNLMARAQTWSN